MMLRSLFFVGALCGLSACATTGPAPTPTAQIQQGQIVLSEAAPAADMTGPNAFISIGSSVVGALIPGPWGGVAGVASGTAGRAAVNGQGGGSMRYHVRMADGSMTTHEQDSGAALAAGTPVNVIAMSDGSTRVVKLHRNIQPATGVTTE